MSLDQLALVLYLLIHDQSSPDSGAVAAVAAISALQLAVMLILRRILRPDDSDGDDPGSGGDGPGWRRRRGPRKPPPDEPVNWPEFEREFAEHVACLGVREREASRPNRDRVGVQ